MKRGRLSMNAKERERKVILESVREGKFKLTEASKRLKISYRQIKRICKRFSVEGDKGLIHGHHGKVSNVAYGMDVKHSIMELYRTKYLGFGPTLACEKLIAHHGYTISDETLRLWLISEGLWDKRRKRKGYRKQRTRRSRFGELLQMDGSHHPWYGDGFPASCLMNLIDDATGKTLSLLAEQETTEAAMLLLKRWIERYGVPLAIYVDLKTVYVSPKTLSQEENEREGFNTAFTHFSKACEKLGIEIIKAYSPQAKGRVERNHAVYQDRFVKELRLQNITTMDKANELLEKSFIEELNRKFAKAPQSAEDAHRNAKDYGDLAQIFCWEYTRGVQQDWTVRYQNKCYQIGQTKPLMVKPKNKVSVRQHLNGDITIWHQDKKLTAKVIEPSTKPKETKSLMGHDREKLSETARKNKHRTPWNQYNPNWLGSHRPNNKFL